jgi:chromosome segregation ATPase
LPKASSAIVGLDRSNVKNEKMTSSDDNKRLEKLEIRLDTFIYESQRLFTRLGETVERNDAAIESMVASIGRLTNGQLRIDNTIEQLATVITRLDQRQSDLETIVIGMNQRQADLEAWKIESDRRHQENEERFNVLLSELRYIINRRDNPDE